MSGKTLSEVDAFLQDCHDRHFQTVKAHLVGQEVEPNQLWLSVGYFLEGTGRWARIKPWSNEEEKQQLLRDTHRQEV